MSAHKINKSYNVKPQTNSRIQKKCYLLDNPTIYLTTVTLQYLAIKLYNTKSKIFGKIGTPGGRKQEHSPSALVTNCHLL